MSSTMHSPDDGLFGDCMQACVASIFELPMEQVPHFTDAWQHDDYLSALRSWLNARDLAPLFLDIPADAYEAWCDNLATLQMDAFHVLGGVSATGLRHAVVARYGRLVHDPWPEDDALRGVLLPDPDTQSFEWCFFVAGRKAPPHLTD